MMQERITSTANWPSWIQCHWHTVWSTVDTCWVRTCGSDRDD